MESIGTEERQVRAARNQSMFRQLNEKLRDVEDALATVTEQLVIACECADTTCVAMLDISTNDYKAVRSNPRWFVVLLGHVYPEVESVIREDDGYVVVEKLAAAGLEAEEAASRSDHQRERS
jgi:hypothetical protein